MAKNSVVTSVVLPVELKEKIARLAKNEDRSFSYIARFLIEAGLNAEEKKRQAKKEEDARG